MKTNFTLKCIIYTLTSLLTFTAAITKAQCVAPAMVWQNAVLVTGNGGQLGDIYKFPSVTPGVDAIVHVEGLVNGATLTSIDDNTYGYSAAWQPVVKTPVTQGVSSSYVSFRIEFKNASDGSIHIYPCFQLSFIDVDGDNIGVKEFVAAKNPDSITVSNLSVLTLEWLTGNLIQATGPILNYSNIDTSSWVTNINYRYSNTDKIIEVRVGNTTNSAFAVQDRYSCGFFQQITMPVVSNILPVKYSSFDAVAANKSVLLKWVTEQEINNNHFEVERSFDGANFTTTAIVLDGYAYGTQKSYMFTDNAAELQTKTVVYYRLKQVDDNDKAVYTNKLVVKLQSKNSLSIQTSPNPFVEDVNIRFTSTANAVAQINIVSITGQKMMTKQTTVSKGSNTLQISGLANLAPGIYSAQLIIDGVVAGTQKIIKN